MVRLKEIIAGLNPLQVIGNTEIDITEVKAFDLNNTQATVISWVNDKNLQKIYQAKHGVIICSNAAEKERLPKSCTFLIVESPRRAFGELLQKFFVKKRPASFISNTAVISENAKIGKNVYIGHNTVIEENVEIGDDVVILHNNSILSETKISNNVYIGSNNTIGGVGFGYEKNEDGSYQVIPHIGNVVIEDNVEIGNNTCIDRAVLGSTFLRKNCKIDNLVHVAHGVEIGENSLIIAHAIIGGSTTIGKNVWVAPNASIINKVAVGDNVTIGIGAVVVKSVTDNLVVVGNPAKPLIK